MTRPIIIPQAERDIAQASEWYESQREGLGAEFLDRVVEGSDRAQSSGLRKVRDQNRRCNLGQFPFALWFKVVDEVVVVGCLHSSRNSILARERGAES